MKHDFSKRVQIAISLAWALIFTATFLLVTGLCTSDGKWYSASMPHRLQTEALSRGSLRLSDSPKKLDFDLVWTRNGIQQIWGLGVPFWRMPFEAGAKLCCKSAFPDRWAFGIAVFLTVLLVVRTFIFATETAVPSNELVAGFGSVLLAIAFPPWIALCLTEFRVYEETTAYSYLYGIVLLCCVARFRRKPTRARWFLLCILSGLSGFIRPTLVAYGFASVVVVLLLHLLSREKNGRAHSLGISDLVPGLAGAFLCLVLLGVTNHFRFGSALEFGHQLNVEDDSLAGSMYSTRFDYPFRQEAFSSAAKELVGILFLQEKANDDVANWHSAAPGSWYAPSLFPGQSATLRVRAFTFRTFDITYAIIVMTGWAMGLWRLIRVVRNKQQPDQVVVFTLWSLLSAAALFVFYLRCPVIASRYTLDFAPAFVAAGIILWTSTVIDFGRQRRSVMWIGFFVMMTWWVTAYPSTRARSEKSAARWGDVRNATQHNVSPTKLGAKYASVKDVHRTGIPYNGTGWYDDGSTAPLVTLFVEDCQFLELEARSDSIVTQDLVRREIRAKLALEPLALEGITNEEKTWVLRFRPRTGYRGIEPLFITFIEKEHLSAPVTRWTLLSVRWREEF